ncbi:MAG: hypothetical protein EAZ65_02105 [Verrucomicrobia bacterium]|nr:MAG: hypothetical protein EAZ84_12710 [Verrucomicrobiota bacterium]TAE88945.1 MAG: hypothetical protein EAZ82_02625 [Verrucomicrobiota bacterium]TAF27361.1 MAG: hypothetical protein EAZ71_02585 [Verrucomicrobiota bacterium]TAF42348.1 MAG: hypothetical protein EAZ65_02105 [Verrucomicrobiota bacterium]
MHSPDNIQYAMETTRVLLEPDRRIDTFGDTRFEFQLLSELMDRAGEVRVRTGEVEAMRPLILRPESMQEIELEGFGEKARERMNAIIAKLKSEGRDLAFLRYGFRFRSGRVNEEIVHDTMDSVRERVLEEARRVGNPALAVIEGVDDAWEVSIFKFAFELIQQSWPTNRFDLHRRGLI